ncbi:MAG: hypothetical protein U9Q81_02120 [Pseudomonadota bacterium]|nr:hypothetical protein [Pseudomonadota bacterium]
MIKKQLVPMALSALLVATPLVMAEEAHHPEQSAEDAASESTAVAPATQASDDAAPAGTGPVTPKAPGMMPPGMSGQGGGMMMPGMMQKGMMGGMQGMGGGPAGGMMKGGPGMMGMGGTMGKGAMMDRKMMGCMQGMGGGMMQKGMMGGHAMMQKHQQVVNRLDLIDARLAKIETLLERLMQR